MGSPSLPLPLVACIACIERTPIAADHLRVEMAIEGIVQVPSGLGTGHVSGGVQRLDGAGGHVFEVAVEGSLPLARGAVESALDNVGGVHGGDRVDGGNLHQQRRGRRRCVSAPRGVR